MAFTLVKANGSRCKVDEGRSFSIRSLVDISRN